MHLVVHSPRAFSVGQFLSADECEALIALADRAVGLEVGVDIEHRSEDIDIEGLGELVFTPAERAALKNFFKTKIFPERVREQICFNETGFRVRLRDEVKMRVEWVRVLEDGSNWWVGEETFGYAELLQILPEKFPGIRE
eukprot:gene11901-15141_t